MNNKLIRKYIFLFYRLKYLIFFNIITTILFSYYQLINREYESTISINTNYYNNSIIFDNFSSSNSIKQYQLKDIIDELYNNNNLSVHVVEHAKDVLKIKIKGKNEHNIRNTSSHLVNIACQQISKSFIDRVDFFKQNLNIININPNSVNIKFLFGIIDFSYNPDYYLPKCNDRVQLLSVTNLITFFFIVNLIIFIFLYFIFLNIKVIIKQLIKN